MSALPPQHKVNHQGGQKYNLNRPKTIFKQQLKMNTNKIQLTLISQYITICFVYIKEEIIWLITRLLSRQIHTEMKDNTKAKGKQKKIKDHKFIKKIQGS